MSLVDTFGRRTGAWVGTVLESVLGVNVGSEGVKKYRNIVTVCNNGRWSNAIQVGHRLHNTYLLNMKLSCSEVILWYSDGLRWDKHKMVSLVYNCNCTRLCVGYTNPVHSAERWLQPSSFPQGCLLPHRCIFLCPHISCQKL